MHPFSIKMQISAVLLGSAFAFIADAFDIQVSYGFCGLVVARYMLLGLTFRR
jgi:hypothetical protein